MSEEAVDELEADFVRGNGEWQFEAEIGNLEIRVDVGQGSAAPS